MKVKCPNWKRDNAERHKLFEGPRKPRRQKREELARVLERLRAPGLRQGIARELSKQVEILEREIAGLEQT